MKNLPTLCNDSSLAVQLSNLVSKTRHFAVYDKDYRNVWTPRKHATDAIRWISSDNQNQSKPLPSFQVVMSLDSINGWLIQTLLRGENDSKQSDEIQANQD